MFLVGLRIVSLLVNFVTVDQKRYTIYSECPIESKDVNKIERQPDWLSIETFSCLQPPEVVNKHNVHTTWNLIVFNCTVVKAVTIARFHRLISSLRQYIPRGYSQASVFHFKPFIPLAYLIITRRRLLVLHIHWLHSRNWRYLRRECGHRNWSNLPPQHRQQFLNLTVIVIITIRSWRTYLSLGKKDEAIAIFH